MARVQRDFQCPHAAAGLEFIKHSTGGSDSKCGPLAEQPKYSHGWHHSSLCLVATYLVALTVEW